MVNYANHFFFPVVRKGKWDLQSLTLLLYFITVEIIKSRNMPRVKFLVFLAFSPEIMSSLSGYNLGTQERLGRLGCEWPAVWKHGQTRLVRRQLILATFLWLTFPSCFTASSKLLTAHFVPAWVASHGKQMDPSHSMKMGNLFGDNLFHIPTQLPPASIITKSAEKRRTSHCNL